jgi:hypothetical protein
MTILREDYKDRKIAEKLPARSFFNLIPFVLLAPQSSLFWQKFAPRACDNSQWNISDKI